MPKWVPIVAILLGAVALGTLIALDVTELALASVGLLLLLLVWVASPVTALMIYVASRPAASLYVYTSVGGLTLGQVWGAGLLVAIIAVSLRLRWGRVSLSDLAPAGVLLAFVLATFWRPDFGWSLVNGLKLASWLLLGMVAQRIAFNPEGARVLLNGGIWTAAAGVAGIGIAVAQDRYGAAYYSGSFSDVGQGPHGFAMLAVLTVPLLLFCIACGYRSRLSAVLLVLVGVAITLSFVRTAVIALGIILVCFMGWSLRSSRRSVLFTGLLGFGALGAGVWALQDVMLARWGDVQFLQTGGGAEVWAGSGRIGIWGAIVSDSFSDSTGILVGRGAGASYDIVRRAMGAAVWAHNDLLEFLAIGGVGLAIVYLAFAWWMIRSAMAVPGAVDPASGVSGAVRVVGLGSVIAFLFMSLVNGVFFYQASLAMALVLGLLRGVTDWERIRE